MLRDAKRAGLVRVCELRPAISAQVANPGLIRISKERHARAEVSTITVLVLDPSEARTFAGRTGGGGVFAIVFGFAAL